MTELVLSLPGQLLAGARLGRESRVFAVPRVRSVTVTGMGGSGIGGRIAAGLLAYRSALPIMTCQDYKLPAAAARDSLVIAVSHSGNTEETLASFAQARCRGCRLVAITGGGELARQAAKARCPIVTIPTGMPPRAALGLLFGALIAVLERCKVASGQRAGLDEAATLMLARRRAWQVRARSIARALHERLPVVYSTSRLLDAVASRWQAQLNENAKVVCHSHVLPEQNHNEIVGLGGPGFLRSRTSIIALVEPGTDQRNLARLRHMLQVTRGAWQRSLRLDAEGRSDIARVFSLIMLGDLVSVELARLRGVDSIAIPRIDELKRRMARR